MAQAGRTINAQPPYIQVRIMSTPCESIQPSNASSISDAETERFARDGLLVIRNLLSDLELQALQDETQALVDRAIARNPADPCLGDFLERADPSFGRIPSRIEYVVDKSPACQALLAHPNILRIVERLQGRSFIPTWDSMVFKCAGGGASVPWHRDSNTSLVDETPIFNVGIYLDHSDPTNCLWAIPGSHLWSDQRAETEVQCKNKSNRFDRDGALPLPMNPGDVILHNVLTVHGSAASRSNLRRVLYFEFRSIATELRKGPHKPAYIPLKQAVLRACLSTRSRTPYAYNECAYVCRPEEAHAINRGSSEQGTALATLRVPHAAYLI